MKVSVEKLQIPTTQIPEEYQVTNHHKQVRFLVIGI